MSQEDVLEVLRARPDYWFSMKEIKEALKAEGKSNGTLQGVQNDVYKLASFGFIDIKGQGLWRHYNTFKMKV